MRKGTKVRHRAAPEPEHDSTSITALGRDPRGKRRSAIQKYGLTRDEITADALAQKATTLKPANGRAEITFDLRLKHAWSLELGHVITLNTGTCHGLVRVGARCAACRGT